MQSNKTENRSRGMDDQEAEEKSKEKPSVVASIPEEAEEDLQAKEAKEVTNKEETWEPEE